MNDCPFRDDTPISERNGRKKGEKGMLCRSDMLKEIKGALEDASYSAVRNIYYYCIGAGLIEEKEEEEHECEN